MLFLFKWIKERGNYMYRVLASLHCTADRRSAVAGVLCWGIFQWPVILKFSQCNVKSIIYIRLPRYLDHNKNLLSALLCNMILSYDENFTAENFCQAPHVNFYLVPRSPKADVALTGLPSESSSCRPAALSALLEVRSRSNPWPFLY